jgi:hypothetical protein
MPSNTSSASLEASQRIRAIKLQAQFQPLAQSSLVVWAEVCTTLLERVGNLTTGILLVVVVVNCDVRGVVICGDW